MKRKRFLQGNRAGTIEGFGAKLPKIPAHGPAGTGA